MAAVNDFYTTPFNTAIVVPSPGVLANDDGSNLTVTEWGSAGNGILLGQEDGGFTYIPDTGFSGGVIISYTNSEGDSALVSMTVGEAPQPDLVKYRFPNDQLAYIPGLRRGAPLTSTRGTEVFVYLNETGPDLAPIQTIDQHEIADSKVNISEDSLIPLFYGPPGVTALWIEMAGSDERRKIYASSADRLDEIDWKNGEDKEARAMGANALTAIASLASSVAGLADSMPTTPADINAASIFQGIKADTAVQPATLTSALASKADLVGGKVPSDQLPPLADSSVLARPTKADFPATGTANRLYIAQTENKTYRWDSTTTDYVQVGGGGTGGVTLGSTSDTAFRGDHGVSAYNHSQASGNPHGTSISDISGLADSLSAKVDGSALKPVATSGSYNDLTNRPSIPTQPSDIGAATSVQGAKADSAVQPATLTSELATKADLVEGKVPSAQLPAFVDDVIERANFAALPVSGETDKIYVTRDTNKTYRWSGTAYVEIGSGVALGTTASTAFRGDHGQTAYNHAQATGNPHGAAVSDITGLTAALSGKADLTGGKVPSSQLPDLLALGSTSGTAFRGDHGVSAYSHSQATGNPHGTAISDITGLTAALGGKLEAADIASKADLVSGRLPVAQLPEVVVGGHRQTVNVQTGTAYAVTNSDAAGTIVRNNAGASTQTWPQDSAATSLPVGTIIRTFNRGAGEITHQAGTGATVLVAGKQPINTWWSAQKIAVNTWAVGSTAQFASGTLANRPAASLGTAMYFASDDQGGTLYLSNGSAWSKVSKSLLTSGHSRILTDVVPTANMNFTAGTTAVQVGGLTTPAIAWPSTGNVIVRIEGILRARNNTTPDSLLTVSIWRKINSGSWTELRGPSNPAIPGQTPFYLPEFILSPTRGTHSGVASPVSGDNVQFAVAVTAAAAGQSLTIYSDPSQGVVPSMTVLHEEV